MQINRPLSVSLAMLLGTSCWASAPAPVRTFYTAKTGSDAFSCEQAQSLSTPKLTIKAGIKCLTNGGDTLSVRAGTYDESIKNPAISGSAWDRALVIQSYKKETVWLRQTTSPDPWAIYLAGDQQFIEFNGLHIDATANWSADVKIDGIDSTAGHIRFRNVEFYRGPATNGGDTSSSPVHIYLASGDPRLAGGDNEFLGCTIHGQSSSPNYTYAFYINSRNNLVDGNEMYDVGTLALQLYANHGGTPDNNVIRNNRVHDLTRTAAAYSEGFEIASGGSNNKIYNNTLANLTAPSNPGAGGIFVASGANNLIAHNTIYTSTKAGIRIAASARGTIVKNNIAYLNGQGDYVNSGSETVASNNLFGINPMFVDPAHGNFQLQSASPAVNAGMPVSLVITDIVGTKRPQGPASDIGAFEHAPIENPRTPPSAPLNRQYRKKF